PCSCTLGLNHAGKPVMRVKRSIELWVVAHGVEVLLLHVGDADVPFWQPVTGGIHDGEDAREAAVRELGEETGLRVDPASLSQVAWAGARWGSVAVLARGVVSAS